MTQPPPAAAAESSPLSVWLREAVVAPKNLTEFAIAHGLDCEAFTTIAKRALAFHGHTEESLAPEQLTAASIILDILMAGLTSPAVAKRS